MTYDSIQCPRMKELLTLMEDFSERSFSAGWSCGLEDTMRKLVEGKEWTVENYGFDTDCCPPPNPHVLARMMFLVGRLNGFFEYDGGDYKWIEL